ncbi:MAG: DUF4390 domain-containing protein [Chromatiales bacterium]|nr:DUF4390 domain-containing protein [Chromatiales bacterium]
MPELLLALAIAATPAHADFAVRDSTPRLANRVLHCQYALRARPQPQDRGGAAQGYPARAGDRFPAGPKSAGIGQIARSPTCNCAGACNSTRCRASTWRSSRGRAAEAESFISLDQALAHLGDFSDFRIPLTAKKEVLPGTRYVVATRAFLNIEALPALMRPLAYATPSWYLGTGWTEWPVQP